jgi:hypothetical protein
MKNNSYFLNRPRKQVKIVFFIFLTFFIPAGLHAQFSFPVTGKVIEEKSNLPVPYATVGLIAISEGVPHFIKGTISGENGSYRISPTEAGDYKLQISSVGYKTVTKNIKISGSGIYDAGTVYLQDSILLLAETVITGDRMKGKTENDRSVYFMNKNTLAASGNTPDLLRHIPGIQVDLKQNISLEGSQDILLFVNGIERDKGYISQLTPAHIDRVEIMNTPASNYDGNVSGVINIVLKNERETGLSGHFFTEIPTSESIVYSFPTYSIQYGLKKINMYTSYNGEINFENIDENYSWQIRGNGQAAGITSVEQVRQKNLSHRFHYGFDYYVTTSDIISYHGSVNPYSYEQDGKVIMNISGKENKTLNTQRYETDKNLNVFNSLYYKHHFNKQGSEISIDISNSYLRANNSISYSNADDAGTASVLNAAKPEQLSTSIKVDYSNPLGEKMVLNTGIKAGLKSMQNETANGFGYNEQLYAIYGAIHYKQTKYNLNFGLRNEYAETELKNDPKETKLSVLPYVTFQYKLSERQNLLLSYRRSLNRPSVFQLNPYTYIDNLYAVRKGNPLLEPEFGQRFYAEHSVRFNVSYISYRLFYENTSNAINNLTFLNDSAVFETQLQNLGDIHQLGIQFLGSLKFGPLTVSPSVRFYNQSTSGNNLAKQYNIENRNNWVFDAGFSFVLSFKHDFAFSGTLQYSTVKYNIQENTFCDALYFLSLDKTFKNSLKVGIMAVLPFARSFVYQGTETEAQNFTSSYRGNLNLPAVPVMFRISYQLQSGKGKAIIERDMEQLPMRPKSGL